jgi:hypothetical protein
MRGIGACSSQRRQPPTHAGHSKCDTLPPRPEAVGGAHRGTLLATCSFVVPTGGPVWRIEGPFDITFRSGSGCDRGAPLLATITASFRTLNGGGGCHRLHSLPKLKNVTASAPSAHPYHRAPEGSMKVVRSLRDRPTTLSMSRVVIPCSGSKDRAFITGVNVDHAYDHVVAQHRTWRILGPTTPAFSATDRAGSDSGSAWS